MRSLTSSLTTVGAVAILITPLIGCGGDSSSSTTGASADELFEQGPDFIDTREALPVLAAYVLAFGRRHVLGQTEWDATLTGPPLGNDGDFVIRVK